MKAFLLQSGRFLIVGILNTLVGLTAIYATMFFFGGSPVTANAIGFAIGLAVGFFLNRAWTFRAAGRLTVLIPRYLGTAAACYLLNLLTVVSTIFYFRVNPYVAQLLGITVYTACMFLGCRWYVFALRKTVNLRR